MDSKMRAYMTFSRLAGPQEGALLVFARTAKEARRKVFRNAQDLLHMEWTDLQVRWLRDGADSHRIPEMEEAGEPYVIEAPKSCRDCELWYSEGYDDDGRCDDCAGLHGSHQEDGHGE